MAEKKKMSVADMLAAARAEVKPEGSSAEPASTQPESSDVEKMSVADKLRAARGGAGASSSEAVAPPADGKKMSVADKLRAARGGAGASSSETDAPPADGKKMSVADKLRAARGGAETSSSATASPPADGKKMSVAEKLAAARSGLSSSPPSPAATKSSKKSAPSKKSPTAKSAPVGTAKKNVQRDTASILAAALSEKKPGPTSKAEAPAFSKPAAKPAAKKVTKPPPRPVPPRPVREKTVKASKVSKTEERRGFLAYTVGSFMAVGFTALSVTGGLFSMGLARYFFPNVLAEPPSSFKVGTKEGFPSGVVETKFVAQYGVWVVNADFEGVQQIYALKTVCTHLGCTPNWLEAEQKFKCPCHGSGFYKDGINFEGPAPRPLERYAIRIADDGQLEIDKSKSFQEELGQWNDPASYVTA